MTSYRPTCRACRDSDPETFYTSCGGCQARRADIEARRRRPAPVLTQDAVDAMDSTSKPPPLLPAK